MRGNTDMSNVQEQGVYELIPEGIHTFLIVETVDGKTRENKDPKVSIKLMPDVGDYSDLWVWDNIIFPKAGSPAEKIMGKTKRFLHCLGEPHEGKIDWDSDNWKGKTIKAKIAHELPNEHHKYPKAIVVSYILEEDEGTNQDEIPF